MGNLTKNFSLSEFEYSETAKVEGIDNKIISEDVKENILYLTETVLQKVRNYFGRPVTISSGYRCWQLNNAVGGSSTSSHMEGLGVDIVVEGISLEDVFHYIRKVLPYDQLILYKNWVHIGIVRNRQQVLIAGTKGYSNYIKKK